MFYQIGTGDSTAVHCLRYVHTRFADEGDLEAKEEQIRPERKTSRTETHALAKARRR